MIRAGSPPSVLLVVASEEEGGLGRVAASIACGLCNLGFRIAAAIDRDGGIAVRLSSHGIAVHIVPELLDTLTGGDARGSIPAAMQRIARLPAAVRALRELARRHDASLVYSHGSWPNHLAAEATRGASDAIRAVWHVHTAWSSLNGFVARRMVRRGRVAAVIGVSESAASHYHAFAPEVHVVHNGVDLERCERARRVPQLRRNMGLGRDAVVIGYVGRLVGHKGMQVLRSAGPRILARLPHAHVVIVGRNPQRGGDVLAALRRRFLQAGVADRLHLPGFVPDALPMMADFDVAVVPSVYEDPCPLALIEALAVGVPVVASRIGGIPELIADGESGLLVNAGDIDALANTVVALADDPARRRQLAEAALRSAACRFDERRMVEEVARILAGTAAGGHRVEPAT